MKGLKYFTTAAVVVTGLLGALAAFWNRVYDSLAPLFGVIDLPPDSVHWLFLLSLSLLLTITFFDRAVQRGRWWIAGLVATTALSMLVGMETLERRGDYCLDVERSLPNSVAVTPFAHRPSSEDEAITLSITLREIVAAIGLPVVDWTVGSNCWETRSEAGKSIDYQREWGAIARDLAVSEVISGRLTTSEARTQLVLGWWTADSTIAEVTVEGEDGQDLLFAAVRQLLVESGRREYGELLETLVEMRNVESLRAYAEGLRNLQRGRLYIARANFEEALRQDSALASAHFRHGQVSAWLNLLDPRVELDFRRAERNLSPRVDRRDSVLIEFHADLFVKDDLAALPRLEGYVEMAGADSDTWYSLGEGYYHFGEHQFRSIREAQTRFERAVELNPGSVFPFIHLFEFALRDHDETRARDLATQLAQMAPGSVWATAAPTAVTLVFESVPRDSILDIIGGKFAFNVYHLLELRHDLADLKVALLDRVARTADTETLRRNARLFQYQELLLQGRVDEACRVLQNLQASPTPNGRAAAVFWNAVAYALGYTGSPSECPIPHAPRTDSLSPYMLWAKGVSAVRSRHWDSVRRYMEALDSLKGAPGDSTFIAGLRLGLAGDRLLEEGRADSAKILYEAAVSLIPIRRGAVRDFYRFRLALALERSGDLQLAYRRLETFVSSYVLNTPSLWHRKRLATQLGLSEDARRIDAQLSTILRRASSGFDAERLR